VLAQHEIVVVDVAAHGRALRVPGDVARGDERVPLQPACIVSRHEQTVVTTLELGHVGLEPVEERHVRLGAFRQQVAASALLDAAVPRAHVLADVAAIDLRLELFAVGRRNGGRSLRPVGEAACRIERAGLVERSGGTRVDAEAALAAIEAELRGRL
jgi:hypothetical protein